MLMTIDKRDHYLVLRLSSDFYVMNVDTFDA